MFCSHCGFKKPEGSGAFCSNCGKSSGNKGSTPSALPGSIDGLLRNSHWIIGACAAGLIVLSFTLSIASIPWRNIRFTAWGLLGADIDLGFFAFGIVLGIMPIALLLSAFSVKISAALATVGAIAQLIFTIRFTGMAEGYGADASGGWFILIIYIAIAAFSIFAIRYKSHLPRRPPPPPQPLLPPPKAVPLCKCAEPERGVGGHCATCNRMI